MGPAMIKTISFISLFAVIELLGLGRGSPTSSLTQHHLCSLCDCKSMTGVLDCGNRNLTEIPSFAGKTNFSLLFYHNNSIKTVHQFPKVRGVLELVLAENEIENIDDSAFKNLVDLIALDLSYNRLNSEKLLPYVFRGTESTDLYEPLSNLTILNIAYNNLHTLNPNLFEHLPRLEHLNLRGNPLKVIGNGIVAALTRIPLLKELNLADTRLKSLPENLFHDTKYLKTLHLSYNLFTEPPESLESSHHLEWLSLETNPFTRIRHFPKLPFLRTLHLSMMPELVSIENRSLSGLPLLEEFYCSDNPKLVLIEENIFSYLNASLGEGEIWPPLKTLVLRNNKLRYIESHLIGRWDYLKRINLQYNPWLCDCENQWMITTLVPLIEEVQPESLQNFKCGLPMEMENQSFVDLYHRNYEMRCLDTYNHKPEKDGTVLIQILIFVVIVAPFLMGAVLCYKRHVKMNRMRVLNNMFIRYSQLDLLPVKNTDF